MSVRLHLPDAAAGERVVTGPRLHYLARVLRVRAGDALEVFDGRGSSFDATVKAIDEHGAQLSLGPGRTAPPPRRITVLQGIPKGDKLELVLQKCTELGAAAFIPVQLQRSVSKLEGDRGAKKVERWRRIAEEAARQSGRSDVPEVSAPLSLEEALGAVAGARLVVLDEEERATSLQLAVAGFGGADPLALLVGPEGGLERAEVEQARAAGAIPITLGRRVLRTETAALVALCLVQFLDGELGS